MIDKLIEKLIPLVMLICLVCLTAVIVKAAYILVFVK